MDSFHRFWTFIENTSAIAFYGIGVAPDVDVYIGDSKGFQSLGSVSQLSSPIP